MSQLMFNIATNRYPGIFGVNKYGHSDNVDTAYELIWDGTGAPGPGGLTLNTSAAVMYVSSDSASDIDVDIQVEGLDENWEMKTARVNTDGFTFVALPGTWRRIFRACVVGLTAPVGNILISDDNTDVGANGIPDTVSAIKAMIRIGYNQTMMCIYTVPAKHTAFMTQWMGSTGDANDLEVELRVGNPNTDSANGLLRVKDELHIYRQNVNRTFKPFRPIPEKSDIMLVAKAATGTQAVSGNFDLILVPQLR